MLRLFLASIILFYLSLGAANAADKVILGDYNSAPRLAGHVDIDKLLLKLKALNVNTYMWLVWHSSNDWSDLKYFLPKAQAAGIDVWVYLIPHSETPAGSDKFKLYSEPYRLDFITWASEIAALSLIYPNLKGYVIDDFIENMIPTRFSSTYIKSMVDAGKSINKNIKFYPIVYFGEINEVNMAALSPFISGVVAAYPPSAVAVENVQPFLNDTYSTPETIQITSSSQSTLLGDGGFVSQLFIVSDATRAVVSFSIEDNYNYFRSGEKFLQVLVDGQVAWQEDVSGYDNGKFSVDLSRFLAGKAKTMVSIGVGDKVANTGLPIQVKLSKISAAGLKPMSATANVIYFWKKSGSGNYKVAYMPAKSGTASYKIPMILMPAGEPAEFTKRYGSVGSPLNISSIVDMSLKQSTLKNAEGVVLYCLDKDSENLIFNSVAEVFNGYGK